MQDTTFNNRKEPQRRSRGETKQNANKKEERRADKTNPSRDCHIVSYMRNFIQKKKEAYYFEQQQHQKS